MLITFLINNYRKMVEFILWVFLIAAAIASIVMSVRGMGVIGIGVFIAVLILELFILPPVLVLFEINENLVKIHKEIKKSESASSKKNKNDLEEFPVNEIKKQEITDERIAEAQKHGC